MKILKTSTRPFKRRMQITSKIWLLNPAKSFLLWASVSETFLNCDIPKTMHIVRSSSQLPNIFQSARIDFGFHMRNQQIYTAKRNDKCKIAKKKTRPDREWKTKPQLTFKLQSRAEISLIIQQRQADRNFEFRLLQFGVGFVRQQSSVVLVPRLALHTPRHRCKSFVFCATAPSSPRARPPQVWAGWAFAASAHFSVRCNFVLFLSVFSTSPPPRGRSERFRFPTFYCRFLLAKWDQGWFLCYTLWGSWGEIRLQANFELCLNVVRTFLTSVDLSQHKRAKNLAVKRILNGFFYYSFQNIINIM